MLASPVLVKVAIGLGAALALSNGAWLAWTVIQGSTHREAIANLETTIAEMNAAVASERETFERDARAKESAQRKALDAIEAEYLRRIEDGKRKADAVVADLRAGNLRLRREWQGCTAAASVPGAADAPTEPDEGAELRRTGAGDLVRIADACDDTIRGLQSVIRAQ